MSKFFIAVAFIMLISTVVTLFFVAAQGGQGATYALGLVCMSLAILAVQELFSD